MEAKKTSSKQVVAILLLVIGLIAGVFGILGLVGGGGMDPYEARNGVVYIYIQELITIRGKAKQAGEPAGQSASRESRCSIL